MILSTLSTAEESLCVLFVWASAFCRLSIPVASAMAAAISGDLLVSGWQGALALSRSDTGSGLSISRVEARAGQTRELRNARTRGAGSRDGIWYHEGWIMGVRSPVGVQRVA